MHLADMARAQAPHRKYPGTYLPLQPRNLCSCLTSPSAARSFRAESNTTSHEAPSRPLRPATAYLCARAA